MEPISYDQFLAAPHKLKPVPVPVAGLEQSLLIHQFTIDEIQRLNELSKDDDAERSLRKQVIYFLRGLDCTPSDDDLAKLSAVFSGWQIRDVYTKAMKLNGFGPDSMREAEKN